MMSDQSFDRLLARLPGLQAEFAAQALNLEGIPCLLECQGVRQTRHPGSEPGDPFAVTLPVSIYVAGSQLPTATEILQSLAADDLIGEQWEEDDEPALTRSSPPEPEAATPRPTVSVAPSDAPVQRASDAMEGTSLRFLLILVGAVLLGWWWMGR